jgi:hypothetical protein
MTSVADNRPMGALFCVDALVAFYRALGSQITVPIEVDQPHGKVHMPLRSCWIPLRDNVTLSAGPLSLNGLPF